MRASVSVVSWALVLGFGMAACSDDPDAAEVPTSPAPAGSASAPEPSQTPGEAAAGPRQSVVRVEAAQTAGPGTVVTADGYILASADVVGSTDDGSLRVILPSGDTAEAEVVGSDQQTNLAVVRAEGAADLTPAVFGDSGAGQVDDEVRLFGGPADSGPPTVGVIRATDHVIAGSTMIEIVFDTTSPVAGGPVVDSDGEIVGILMTISTAVGGEDGVRIGHAVPSDIAGRVATELIETGQVARPHLGVQVGDTEGEGALVHEVIAGSPADRAGLQAGDVIDSVGDEPLEGPDALVAAVRSSRVGDELRLTFTRDGAEQEVSVVLDEAPLQDQSE